MHTVHKPTIPKQ